MHQKNQESVFPFWSRYIIVPLANCLRVITGKACVELMAFFSTRLIPLANCLRALWVGHSVELPLFSCISIILHPQEIDHHMAPCFSDAYQKHFKSEYLGSIIPLYSVTISGHGKQVVVKE